MVSWGSSPQGRSKERWWWLWVTRKKSLLLAKWNLSDTQIKFCVSWFCRRSVYAHHTEVLSRNTKTQVLQYELETKTDTTFTYKSWGYGAGCRKQGSWTSLKNIQNTAQLRSFHVLAELRSNSFKLGFSSTWTENFQRYKLYLEKPEEPEIKLPRSVGPQKKQGNSRKTPSASLTTLKPLTVWITTNCGKILKIWEYQTILPASWETCMQVKKQQLEPDMEQRIGSKLGKQCAKAVYCHLAYLT